MQSAYSQKYPRIPCTTNSNPRVEKRNKQYEILGELKKEGLIEGKLIAEIIENINAVGKEQSERKHADNLKFVEELRQREQRYVGR